MRRFDQMATPFMIVEDFKANTLTSHMKGEVTGRTITKTRKLFGVERNYACPAWPKHWRGKALEDEIGRKRMLF